MTVPQIAVLISSFQRADHLRRVLESVRCQHNLSVALEVIVSDDGSTDATPDVVADFAAQVQFRVRFVTHPHSGFHLTRCRNEGVAASVAPYLVFLDGDCLIPPGYLQAQWTYRRPGSMVVGDCVRLDRVATEKVTLDVVRCGAYRSWVAADQQRYIRRMAWKGSLYEFLRHPRKPKLFGGNVALWRYDYERVNGYDENFRAWGCEDDDLNTRLRRIGVRARSLVRRTHTYHLWHPPGPGVPSRWRDGLNVSYFLHAPRPVRCRLGLDQHTSRASLAHPLPEAA